MKKVVALLMAAVLTVGMTVTAFAAPSPSANADIVTAAKDADAMRLICLTLLFLKTMMLQSRVR